MLNVDGNENSKTKRQQASNWLKQKQPLCSCNTHFCTFFCCCFARLQRETSQLGLVHTYPDIFESATVSFGIQNFPCPHVSVFKSNLPIHHYSTQDSSIHHYSTQDSSRNISNRLCVERCAKLASFSAWGNEPLFYRQSYSRISPEIKENAKSNVDSFIWTGKRENLETRLSS